MELQRIVRDLSQFHDTVNITCNKEGIQFSTTADSSTSQARILLRPTSSVDTKGTEVCPVYTAIHALMVPVMWPFMTTWLDRSHVISTKYIL